MRPRVVRASLMGIVLALATVMPAQGAGPPETGSRYLFSWGGANLVQGGLWDCGVGDAAGATLGFGFVSPGTARDPIASGDPVKWTDIDLYLQVYGCESDEPDYWDFEGHSLDLTGLHDLSGISANMSHGQLSIDDLPLWDADQNLSEVVVTFDLTWQAIGSPETEVGISNGSKFVQQVAPAAVSGTVVFEHLPFSFGDKVSFDVEYATEGNYLGRSTSIVTP